MTDHRGIFQPIPADYPNHLAAQQPQRRTVRRAGWVLVGLVALCLLPRTLVALKTQAVCADGTIYIRLATALGQGDLQGAMEEMRLNTYPVVLLGLHRLGFDWAVGGKLWGVVLSSLLVLPMFGWTRRQFDDRVALVACLLYAVHANVIEWSHELIRGPTFWFLFVLAIYLLWRAVAEVRPVLFLAAGGAIALASLTRVEGLFLFLPLMLWSITRWRALRVARGRLLFGAVLAVAFFPVLLAVVNFVWLRDLPEWQSVRSVPLELAQGWFRAMAEWAFGPAAAVASGVAFQPASPLRLTWLILHTLERGLTPPFALAMLGGILAWRRVWWRSDSRPLFYVALAVIAGMWIHAYHVGESSQRYPITIVLLATPMAALGILGLGEWMLEHARRWQWRGGPRFAMAAVPLALVAAIGLADSLTRNYDSREAWARLGCWVQQRCGPAPSLIGPPGLTSIAGYYAEEATESGTATRANRNCCSRPASRSPTSSCSGPTRPNATAALWSGRSRSWASGGSIRRSCRRAPSGCVCWPAGARMPSRIPLSLLPRIPLSFRLHRETQARGAGRETAPVGIDDCHTPGRGLAKDGRPPGFAKECKWRRCSSRFWSPP